VVAWNAGFREAQTIVTQLESASRSFSGSVA
jgi:hypothetical protein